MLTLWNPRNDFFRLSRHFDDFFTDAPAPRGFAPAVDVEETENAFVLHADLPGIAEKDIEIRIHEGTLVLSGTRETVKKEEKDGGYLRERSFGSFRREFRLGPNVAADKIEAAYKNGVLTVTLPKKEDVKPRQIPIQAS